MFINIFNASVAAVWLILAVVVLRLLLRRAPRWIICVLWGMAGLRLLLPFSIESAFSLVPSARTMSPTIGYDTVPQIDSGVNAVNDSINPILSDHFAATPQYSVNPMQILLDIVQALWVAGMVIMVLHLVISFIALRLRMRTATRLRGSIMQSERVTSPFVMGIFRPTVYLPYGMDSAVEEYVIAHELAHIRRGDHIVKPLAFLVLTLHWFNPFVWLAYVLLCRDIEMACDQRAVKDMTGACRKEYSRALVKGGSSRRLTAVCPLAFGEVGVKTRVKNVLSYRKPALWMVIGAAAVCALTAVCFLTDPFPSQDAFGRRYREDTLIYTSPVVSVYAGPTEEYRLTADCRLVHMSAEGEKNLGRLTGFDLTGSNFDDLFFAGDTKDVWNDGVSAASLRRGNRSAWYIDDGDSLYYILQQRNGEIYLAAGSAAADPKDHPGANEGALRPTIVRLFRLNEMQETDPTDLDRALTKAALKRNSGGFMSGEFRCAAHTLLTTEREMTDSDTCRLTAYALMLYSEYDLVGGMPEDVSGSSCPVAVTFDITAQGEYTVVEYWEPDDGTLYAPSLRAKFPSGVTYNTQFLFDQRKSECDRQAREYFGLTGSSTPLDAAINKAALEHNDGAFLSGQFKCAAHTVLSTQSEQLGNSERVTAYVIVLYQEYGRAADGVYVVSGGSTPVTVTFDVSDDGKYTLVEYWEQQPGAGLEGKFPEDLVFEDNYGSEAREQECLRQACEYFGVAATTAAADSLASMTTTTVTESDQRTYPADTLSSAPTTAPGSGQNYICNTEIDVFGPCTLTLSPDGTAVLTFGYLSSYVAVGTYEMDGNLLVITTDDGLGGRYVFSDSYKNSFLFVAEESSRVPSFKPSQNSDPVAVFSDGAEFILIG